MPRGNLVLAFSFFSSSFSRKEGCPMATVAKVSANERNVEARPISVPEPVLLTIKQAASRLGATVSAIRNLIWDEDLRVVPLGQRHMIRVSDLDAWVSRNSLLAGDLDDWKKARKAVRAPRRSEAKTGANRDKVRGKRSA